MQTRSSTDHCIRQFIKYRENGAVKLLFRISRWGKGVSSRWADVQSAQDCGGFSSVEASPGPGLCYLMGFPDADTWD